MSTTIVSTVVVDGEIPPARTPFKIQDPYTGRFVWNRDDNLHLRGNGEGEELLWELEHAATTAVCADSETGYLLKNVLTGKVMVDESDGDGRLSRGFGVKEIAESGSVLELESQIWTMRPLECDAGPSTRRGFGRLYCIQNRRNRAYIVNGLQARGKKQLRTRVTNEESKSQAWRFVLMSEPPTVLRSPDYSPPTDFESRPSTSTPGPPDHETPPIIASSLRAKRSRSGDYTDSYRDYEGSGGTEHNGGEPGVLGLQLQHDRNFFWKRMPPIPEDCHDHVGRKRSSSTTVGDSNFLQEAQDSSCSWMSQPHWRRWISAVSDFDVSRITPKIGTCTTTALNENGSFMRAGGNDLLTDSPWYFQPRLEESP